MPKFKTKIPSQTVPTLNVMVGVAGHIDHGKTELVKMLTGCDTDRLKEEKERGMSIELGYAPCYVESGRFGIVDVPGHERFVRKMVAGATGIDLALLVIAADDGVMPQTREHLDILELLGTKHLLVALSKIDLVSPERVHEVTNEIHTFLQSTNYPNASITPVSSMTGDGIDVMRSRLQESVDAVNRRKTNGVFRLAVDRIFSSPGHGTIITGIASSGSVRIGDSIEILPLAKSSRVRGLQVYLSDSQEAVAGQCIALNLPSIRADEVERGCCAAAPGRFYAASNVLVWLRASRFLDNPLPNAARIHFHAGTSETTGKLRLLDRNVLEAGDEAFAQILLNRPICAFLRDRFILRLPSPTNTVAGGTILDVRTRRARRNHEPTLERLNRRWNALDTNDELLLSLMDDFPAEPQSIDSLSQLAGLQKEETLEALSALKNRGAVFQKNDSFVISIKSFKQACAAVMDTLRKMHKSNPLRYAFSTADISKQAHLTGDLLQEALSRLVDEQKLTSKEGSYRAADAPQIDPKMAQLAQTVERILNDEKFQTPSPKQLSERTRKPTNQIDAALRVLMESGRVRRLAEGIYLHEERIQWAKNQLIEAIQRDGFYETHLFKTLIDSSRKYAIPLLDYFDATGLTRREGGKRFLIQTPQS